MPQLEEPVKVNPGPPVEEEPEPSKPVEEPPEKRPVIETNPGPPSDPPK